MNTTRKNGYAIEDCEKKVLIVNEIQKTFNKMQNTYSEMSMKVQSDNLQHREKMKSIVEGNLQSVE